MKTDAKELTPAQEWNILVAKLKGLEKEWQDICTANNSGRSPRFSDAVTNVSHRISVVGMQVELLNADFEKRLQVLETIVTEQVE